MSAIAIETPWFVRVTLGAVAWLGGTFLLGFVTWLVGDDAAALPAGVALLAASIALRRAAPAALRDLWVQTSLLGMVAARGAIGLGVSALADERAAFAALFAVEGLAFALYPGRAPRLASVAAAWTWLACAIGEPVATEVLAVAALAVCVARTETAGLDPLGIGSGCWALVALAGTHSWLVGLAVALAGAALAARWLDDGQAAPLTWAGAGASAAALVAVGGSVPGTLVGLVVAAVAFRHGSRLWLGAALAACVGHVVWLYWQMDASFLEKGAAMIGLGLVLYAVAALAGIRR